MTTKKAAYLAACMNQTADWLRRSAAQPSKYMTRTDVVLHLIAIRRKEGKK